MSKLRARDLRALAGAALLAAAAGARADDPPARAPTPDAGPAASAEGSRRPDGGTPPEPDPEILDHLDEIQNLELLENLDLFDPGTKDEGEKGAR